MSNSLTATAAMLKCELQDTFVALLSNDTWREGRLAHRPSQIHSRHSRLRLFKPVSQFVTVVVLSVAGRPVHDEGRRREADERDNPPQFPFHPD